MPHTRPEFFRSRLAAGIIVALFALAPLVSLDDSQFPNATSLSAAGAALRQRERMNSSPEGSSAGLKPGSPITCRWKKSTGTFLETRSMRGSCRHEPSITPGGRDATLAMIADYNQSQDMTPELDARFGKLAADRIRAHPIRYYAVLPVLRVADMWLRPRTEILPARPALVGIQRRYGSRRWR